MGCGGSKAIPHQRQQPEGRATENTPASQDRQETDNKPDTTVNDVKCQVTKEQIGLVKETWGLVKDDLEQIGVEFYVSLFKEDPHLVQLFPYMDDQSTHYVMRIDDRVKRKGLVTMQHVDMAVASLKDPGSRVHYQKLSTFCPRKSKSVGAAFLRTLEKRLGNKFTKKVKEAWTAVYGLVAENRDGEITEEQITLVQESWGLVKDDLEQMRVEFYVSLFKEDPEHLKLFPYMDDQSTHYVMKIDDRVKRKGLVTMQHVDMAVASLKDPDSRVHYQKSSTFCPRKSKSVGAAFLHTLNKHLGKKFTPKVKEAWTAVYGLVAENSDGEVTEEQIALVQETWGLVKNDLEQMGVEFYARLFKEDPELLKQFPYMDDQSTHYVMRIDDRVKRKGLVTMQHVDMAVESLDDLDSQVHYQKLSTFCPRKLKSVGAALIRTLEKHLGKKFTTKAKEAWTALYKMMTETAKAGAKKVVFS
ncbi:uncharacterized protein LOC144635922 [Oculina patagonica]